MSTKSKKKPVKKPTEQAPSTAQAIDMLGQAVAKLIVNYRETDNDLYRLGQCLEEIVEHEEERTETLEKLGDLVAKLNNRIVALEAAGRSATCTTWYWNPQHKTWGKA